MLFDRAALRDANVMIGAQDVDAKLRGSIGGVAHVVYCATISRSLVSSAPERRISNEENGKVASKIEY